MATHHLIAAIGKASLVKLQNALGPSHTYIPTEPDPESPIAKAVGIEDMQKLCDEFGGSSVWIGNGYATQQRNEEILRLVLASVSKENIAKSYGVTARYVRILTQAERAMVYGRRARHARRKKALAAFGRRPVRRRAIISGTKRKDGEINVEHRGANQEGRGRPGAPGQSPRGVPGAGDQPGGSDGGR